MSGDPSRVAVPRNSHVPLGVFYRLFLLDLMQNLKTAWPIGVLLFAIVMVLGMGMVAAGDSLAKVDNKGIGQQATFGEAIYCVWMTMTTVGYGDFHPVTTTGRIIASVAALIGLLLVGLLVALFSRAWERGASGS
jgi:Ion channel